jgi:hypothetical protein
VSSLLQSAIVHSNFEALLVETLSIVWVFPFVKLSTNKCYDWSSKISQQNVQCVRCHKEFSQQNKHWKEASQAILFLFELLQGKKVQICLVFNNRRSEAENFPFIVKMSSNVKKMKKQRKVFCIDEKSRY